MKRGHHGKHPPDKKPLPSATPPVPVARPASAALKAVGEGGTLNVIFHGTFAFRGGENQILALIPDNPEHVYRAGSWLGETELRRGTYQLDGVDLDGKKKLSPDHNLILPCGKQKPDVQVYATLILPRPKEIKSLRRVRVRAADFDKPKLPGLEDVKNLATLQVFTYTFKSDAKLALRKSPDDAGAKAQGQKAQGQKAQAPEAHEHSATTGHFWEPTFASDTINLHIFSAPDHDHGPSHVTRSFQSVAALLGHDLVLLSPPPANPLEVAELPAGVSQEETEDLAPRMKRMARLGRMRSQDRDLNQLWFKSEPLDGDPGACTCAGCDG